MKTAIAVYDSLKESQNERKGGEEDIIGFLTPNNSG